MTKQAVTAMQEEFSTACVKTMRRRDVAKTASLLLALFVCGPLRSVRVVQRCYSLRRTR